MDEERLEELLLRWEELSEAGQTVAVEQLCRDCPELIPELQRRIDALRRVAWVAQPSTRPQDSSSFTFLLPDKEPIPGYRLVQPLGKGGFAEVWKADGPNGPVALKFVPQSDKAAGVELRSLAVIKHLEHPNLLRTYETWQSDGHVIVAMELADSTLMDRWQQARAEGLSGIPREELLRYLRDAAEGIDFLQKRYIQHRDIKPQNLFLVGDTLKVGDFGLTRLLAHSVTGHTGSLTLSYAPPEFFEGKTTRQSDVYSLAVTYCQMRGGRLPFEGSPAALVAAHLSPTPDLSMLPPEERPAVEKALAKRPAERWPTCRAFVEALSNPAELTTETQRHREDKIRTNPWRLLSRRSLLLLFCLLCASVSLWFLARTQPEAPTETPAPLRAFEVPQLPPRAKNLIRNVAAARMGEPFNGVVALSNGAGGPKLWDVATGCDSTVRLFDRRSGKEIHCLRGHKGIVMSVAFGPKGKRAVSGGWDGTARVWDLDTGKQLVRFDGHTSKVWCVASSPDGRWGLSSSEDRVIRLWDINSGEEVRRFEGHTDLVGSVMFRVDSILSVGDHTARVWQMSNGQELYRSPQTPSAAECGTFVELDGVPPMLLGTSADGLQLWRLPRESGLLSAPP